jgi:hypothetical protein
MLLLIKTNNVQKGLPAKFNLAAIACNSKDHIIELKPIWLLDSDD